MKKRTLTIVLVALVALMAASGASAKKMLRANANVHAAPHSLVKQANKSAAAHVARWSHRALL